MIYYNYDLLKKLLTEFSILAGSKVSIWNEQLEPTDAKGNTDNTICSLIKQRNREWCTKSDNEALNKCVILDSAHYYHCHFGFYEIMVKENIENVPFYICLGPYIDPEKKKATQNRIKEYCESVNVDPKPYLDRYKDIPELNEEVYESIVSMIHVIFEHCKETKIIAIKEDFFEAEIAPFLKENINKNYSITELCEIFNIPAKKFHMVVKKATGLTPKQYITKLKIDKAYEEVILTRKELQVIAIDVGIEDYNYFIKLFKAQKGHTPKYFRKQSEIQE